MFVFEACFFQKDSYGIFENVLPFSHSTCLSVIFKREESL
ncbi:hypothetical protein HMPREF0083_02552 [Aneurinibacillus aneurinilyticus ATCC 12856]|uniref:Uncharacterized protein n=1 Tax=Aneurinibacillus aneurinilyticus ATCC 12856 TaxID=649747 RepID=U1YB98_ANEAE|nr:hypothetical protein HMPREF0083_02552 [Aneurinibacillus aneurinilyticus ATCC 12856]